MVVRENNANEVLVIKISINLEISLQTQMNSQRNAVSSVAPSTDVENDPILEDTE